jgi:hypothetical protein
MVGAKDIASALDRKARSVLSRLLRRGDYATADLQPVAGPGHEGERRLVERIRSGMIMADVYPTSPRQKGEFDRLALSTWDNEGGSMAKAGPLRSTTARSGQP